MMDENEILSEELYSEFDSSTLLDAVGHLDRMRQHLGDGVNLEPPQIRQDLMDLYGMVMDASNGSSKHSIEDIALQVSDIENSLLAIQEAAERIFGIFRNLNEALNEARERMEEEE